MRPNNNTHYQGGDPKSPTPPDSPHFHNHMMTGMMMMGGGGAGAGYINNQQHLSQSPSPPQPIPIQMMATPGRPSFAMSATSPGTPMSATSGSGPAAFPIAQTPDRPPRVWQTNPGMVSHHHHQNSSNNNNNTQPLSMQHYERQDVQIDGSLEENELVGLDLSSARIRALPLGLLNYTDFLTELRLNSNLLTTLPAQVGDLRSLVILDLSDNALSFLPPELGKLTNLVELLLYNNRLSTLPAEMGYLYQLENLGLDGNPWDEPLTGVLMTQGPLAIIPFLRDNLLVVDPPPERIWQVLDNSPPTAGNFTLLTYNILAEKYATPQMYGYVPSWFLTWEVRKQMVLHELLTYDPDIICLQEVEANQFEQYFKPQLRMRGNYDGIFSPKSRARTMNEWDRSFVDGCAIFFKLERFRLVEQQLIEFNQLALARPSLRKHRDMYNRVMTRDNIALIARLELLDVPVSSPHAAAATTATAKHPELIIGNVHIHWDPTFRDVKLVQAIMLAEELEKVVARAPKAGLVLCGDFNSLPDSGVLQFLATGSIGPKHADFMEHTYEPYSNEGARHRLQLVNAFEGLMEGGLLPVTNFTPGFCGVIDHVLFRPGPLTLTGVLGGIPQDYLRSLVGFPTQHQPSDHVSLMAEFRVDHPPTVLTTPGGPPGLVQFSAGTGTSQPKRSTPLRFGPPHTVNTHSSKGRPI